MNNNLVMFWALIAIGVIVILVSVFAHQLGLGSAGFGTKKVVGVIVGAVILLIGVWGMMQSRRASAV
jgi:hypothetical protein